MTNWSEHKWKVQWNCCNVLLSGTLLGTSFGILNGNSSIYFCKCLHSNQYIWHCRFKKALCRGQSILFILNIYPHLSTQFGVPVLDISLFIMSFTCIPAAIYQNVYPSSSQMLLWITREHFICYQDWLLYAGDDMQLWNGPLQPEKLLPLMTEAMWHARPV